METIRVTSYGKKEGEPVRILVPHDASFESFVSSFPDMYRDIMDAVEVDEKTLKKFLTIEQDVFATEAAEQIAKKIVETLQGGTRVEIVKVLIPRGILDMNRIKSKAVWHIFDHEEHDYLVRELEQLYVWTYQRILSVVRQSAMVIDLHTMSPTDPWEQVSIDPKNMSYFIQTWQTNPNKPRKNDIIGYHEDNGVITPLGDGELVKSVSKSFEDHDIPYALSGTYMLNGIHLGSKWAKTAKSYINLDITKDNGSKETPKNKSFDLSDLTYDEGKLSKITSSIAEGVIRVLKERLKKQELLIQ